MFVKICGITNQEDAFAAAEVGAGALGFIFHRGSPRYVDPEHLSTWIGGMPGSIWKVGVFVDELPEKIEAICGALSLDVAQLHGSEDVSGHPRNVRIWKAFRVVNGEPFDHEYPAEAILLDGPGGGRTFDWSVCSAMRKPFILAGGLDDKNIAEAIERTNPWGVDVASGVEAAPGRKDHARMERFIRNALRPAMQEQHT